VRKVLVTGMSGTGKSSALAELRLRGFETVDTDEPGWSEWSDEDAGYVWREDRIAELLAGERNAPLVVSGTVSNQGRFYPEFDAVVLLSAPAEVLLDRIADRTTNDYGKSAEERDLILEHRRGGRAAAPRNVHARARREPAAGRRSSTTWPGSRAAPTETTLA
jgi:dephospho-CoA kinase